MSTQTVSDIIEEVKAEICDGYCKYPAIYKDMDKDEFYLIQEVKKP